MDVTIRDAVESDARTLGSIVDLPADALRNVVHDRTVRLAVTREPEIGPNADVGAPDESDGDAVDSGAGGTGDSDPDLDDDESVLGFVAFDVRDGTVHVTQLAGDEVVAEQLLAEPIRFALNEGFSVEFVVPRSDDDAEAAAEAAGFAPVGRGPRFDGEPTTRYRYRPEGD